MRKVCIDMSNSIREGRIRYGTLEFENLGFLRQKVGVVIYISSTYTPENTVKVAPNCFPSGFAREPSERLSRMSC